MTAYVANIAIILKEHGYVFNDLRRIPVPKEQDYVFVEDIRTYKVMITNTSVKDIFTLVKVGSSYYKFT